MPSTRAARPSRTFQTAFWIDRWLGPPLCGLLSVLLRVFRRERPATLPAEPRKVLLLKFWGMGSIVLASPLFREIRERHPDAQIDFVTLASNAPLLSHFPQIRRAHTVDLSAGILRFLGSTLLLLRRIRAERYDLLLDLEFFTSYSAIFSVFAGPRYSSGFSSRGSLRGRLHDAQIPFNSYHHVVLNFLALLHPGPAEALPRLDIESSRALPRIVPDPSAQHTLAQKLEAQPRWRGAAPLVVVNPNAGEMALERRWPLERAAGFLGALAAEDDLNIIVTGSPRERDFVADLLRHAQRTDGAATPVIERVIDLAGQISTAELVALLARADVVVSNDSGPLHIAAGAGTSTVALFGPETPELYGPLRAAEGQRHRVHYRSLTCSPCINVHNNKVLSCWFVEAACMRGIAVEEVLAATRELLGRPTSLAVALPSASGQRSARGGPS